MGVGVGGGCLSLKIDGGVLLATENWTHKDRGKKGIWGKKMVVLVPQKIVLVLVNYMRHTLWC